MSKVSEEEDLDDLAARSPTSPHVPNDGTGNTIIPDPDGSGNFIVQPPGPPGN